MATSFTEVLGLGERLTRARNHLGISREALAAQLDIHPRSVTNYEHDNRKISLDLACRWAQVTGVPLEYFAAAIGEETARSLHWLELAAYPLAGLRPLPVPDSQVPTVLPFPHYVPTALAA